MAEIAEAAGREDDAIGYLKRALATQMPARTATTE